MRRLGGVALWFGRILQVAALGFVVYLLHTYFNSVVVDRALFLGIGVAALIALAAQLLPIVGWWRMVGGGRTGIAFAAVYDAYARSALAKYLPGNILHYAGRQVMGSRHGLGQAQMAAASAAEILLVVAAGCLVAAVAIPSSGFSTGLPAYLPGLPMLLALGIVAAAAITLAIGRLNFGLPPAWRLPPLPPTDIAAAFACNIAFISLGALAFVAIGLFRADQFARLPLDAAVAAYALGYVIGYLTPGSPGGLGVREAALVMLLTPGLGQETPLVMAIGLRLAWILAELVHFGLALALAAAAERHRTAVD